MTVIFPGAFHYPTCFIMTARLPSILLLFACFACTSTVDKSNPNPGEDSIVRPVIITQKVKHDTDDPAIWINRKDPSASLIVGTDKDKDGALYVFDLSGKIVENRVVRNLQRPNNVDIEYGLLLNNQPVDIAVVTERLTHKLRIFSLPDMLPVDNGGIEVFEGETGSEYRDLMGIALYKNKSGQIFAVVGRKNGPQDGSYLWQYLLSDNGNGKVKVTLVRKFGAYSGHKEIEAIAVDDHLGYIYYADEGVGVRKYYADPSKGNQELALFGRQDFVQDHEGISLYYASDSTGYIIVSDQQRNYFNIYPREGMAGSPNNHPLLKRVHLSTQESDGSDVINVPRNDVLRKCRFVAMSTDSTFQYYRWEDMIKIKR